MTRKLNKDNGLQDWKTEHQAVYFIAEIVGISAFLHLINFCVTLRDSASKTATKTYRQTVMHKAIEKNNNH